MKDDEMGGECTTLGRDEKCVNYVCGILQSSSTLWNYNKCGVYTVESEAGC
jgi:hypothetical protein